MNITLHSRFECLQTCSVICYVISYFYSIGCRIVNLVTAVGCVHIAESAGSRRELVANSCTHRRRDVTKQFHCVGVGGVYWALTWAPWVNSLWTRCCFCQLIKSLSDICCSSWSISKVWARNSNSTAEHQVPYGAHKVLFPACYSTVTLTFDPQNLMHSSLSHNASLMQVWWKSAQYTSR